MRSGSSGQEEDRVALLDIMFCTENVSCGFDVEEIAEAFQRVRQKDLLDCDSIALSAVELLFISNPFGVSQFLNAFVADTPSMTMRGHSEGERLPCPCVL